MNVRNCRKCGRIFNYSGRIPLCPSCLEAQEAKFHEVKEYIRDNKNVGVQEVAQSCDVEVGQIRQWIREERLAFSDDSPVGINCENCGCMIKTGRYCEKCKREMASELASVGRKPKPILEEPRKDPRENPKMRYLDR